ncbi:MAG: carboxypeptidase-like regulatory domain-containing protein [Bacteroidota bacterium]
MKRSFKLDIPKPCHEKWENFNPTSLGGFCSACQKEVIDFTSWSDEKIKSYFLQSNGYTCGRFKAHQLKYYQIEEVARQRSWLPLSVLGLTLLFTGHSAEAKEIAKEKLTIVPNNNRLSFQQVVENDSTTQTIIAGTVRSKSNEPLPGVTVTLKNSSVTAYTNESGQFVITIDKPAPDDMLVFAFIGLITLEQNVYEKNNLEIVMEDDVEALSEVVVVGGMVGGTCAYRPWSPRGIWQRIKNIFR